MRKIALNNTYQIDLDEHTIRNVVLGTEKKVEPRLMKLLEVLVAKEGRMATRTELIQKVWGNYGDGDKYLTHSVCLLRSVLDHQIIKTIPKQGYLLDAQVQQPSSLVRDRLINQFTFSRVAAAIVLLLFLKMLIFPHH